MGKPRAFGNEPRNTSEVVFGLIPFSLYTDFVQQECYNCCHPSMVQGPQRRSFQEGLPNSLRFLSFIADYHSAQDSPWISSLLMLPPYPCLSLSLFLSTSLLSCTVVHRFLGSISIPHWDNFGKSLMHWCLEAASMK